ncbi:MAG TPA: DUF4190 domain-containing protein [Actinocrinis sp.]
MKPAELSEGQALSEAGRHPLPGDGGGRPSDDAPASQGPEAQPPSAAADTADTARIAPEPGFAAPGPQDSAALAGPAPADPNSLPLQPFAPPAPIYGPYGYPPPPAYSPYGMPPLFAYPPPQRPPTNGLALVGLLTAIFFWPAGLVLSAVGLRRSRQLGGAGRGQAVAGLVIAPISAAITVLIAIGLIAAASAISDANGSMFGDAPNDPGCALILSSLPAVPSELQAAATGPQAAIGFLNGLGQSVQSAESAAVNVEVSDDLDKLDGDISTVTVDLQAILGGGTAGSTGVNGDIAELDTDSGALQSLCTGAS